MAAARREKGLIDVPRGPRGSHLDAPLLALHVISRRRSNSVAFGVKRTFGGTRIQNRIYEYAP